MRSQLVWALIGTSIGFAFGYWGGTAEGAWTEPVPGAPGSEGYQPPPNVVPGTTHGPEPSIPVGPDDPGPTPPPAGSPSEAQNAICFLRLRPPTGIRSPKPPRRLVRLVSLTVVSCSKSMTSIIVTAKLQRRDVRGKRWVQVGAPRRAQTGGLSTAHARVAVGCGRFKGRSLQPRYRVIARATAFEEGRIVYQVGWTPGVAKRFRCRTGRRR